MKKPTDGICKTSRVDVVDLPPDLNARLRKTLLENVIAGCRRLAIYRPEVQATYRLLGGGVLCYCGPHNSWTRAYDIGFGIPIDCPFLKEIESFFEDRGANVEIALSNAREAAGLLGMLVNHGYERKAELRVFWRRLPCSFTENFNKGIETSSVLTDADRAIWVTTVYVGFREERSTLPNSTISVEELDRYAVMASEEKCTPFLSKLDNVAVGGGMLRTDDGTALLRSTSVRFAARGRGVQRALIAARLSKATELGCDVAFAIANPNGTSERNLRQFGFLPLSQGCLMVKRSQVS